MAEGKSVGSRNGQYVELDTLRAYLRAQYPTNGPRIADHKFFGRRFLPEGGLGAGRDGAYTACLIPIDSVGDYLSEQYAGMGGCEIADSPKFLRNIPTVRISELSLNLV